LPPHLPPLDRSEHGGCPDGGNSSSDCGKNNFRMAFHGELLSLAAIFCRELEVHTNSEIYDLLLFLVLLSYTLCSVFAIIGTLIVMFDSAPLVVLASTCLYYFCYYYINGLMFCLVVERLLATVMMRTYEHNRRWWPVALSQPFAVGFLPIGLAVGNFFLPNLFSRSLTMLSLYALNILCLIALLLINYRITTALTGSGASLSTRYQITENIRTIRQGAQCFSLDFKRSSESFRVLLPTVLFDALVSVVDVCGSIFFEVHHIFDISRCSDDEYIKFFYGCTTVSTFVPS
ncbi:hypothetical protein ANCCAN_17648, partial [Ancylostoma caninum]